METISEGTVGSLAGISVGMGQISMGTYTLPDGTAKQGLSATIAPFDSEKNIPVGAGSKVVVGDVLWHVEQIMKVDDTPGHIRLKPLHAVKPTNGNTVRAEALDMTYKKDCVRCGHDAGWSGKIEKHGRDIHMIYFCTQCQLDYSSMDGSLQRQLKKNPPVFRPGA